MGIILFRTSNKYPYAAELSHIHSGTIRHFCCSTRIFDFMLSILLSPFRFGFLSYASSTSSIHLRCSMKRYSDLDLDFFFHPVTGKISKLLDVEAVKRSIRNLVLTNNYERFFQPDIGSNVTSFLFSPTTTPFTAIQIQTAVEDTIKSYEPRAILEKVTVSLNADLNRFDVSIVFSVRNLPEPVELTLFLKRTR